jgi:hypothetical protein
LVFPPCDREAIGASNWMCAPVLIGLRRAIAKRARGLPAWDFAHTMAKRVPTFHFPGTPLDWIEQ